MIIQISDKQFNKIMAIKFSKVKITFQKIMELRMIQKYIETWKLLKTKSKFKRENNQN